MKRNAINMNTLIGSELRNARIEKGMSQTDVANRLGLTKQAISHYEIGRRAITFEFFFTYCSQCGFDSKKILSNLSKYQVT